MKREKEVEEIYQKKTQIEHILLRPDTYVGSIERTEANLWVKNPEKEEFEQKKLEYCPALYKIFDEILVNAADNYHRDGNTRNIKVNIDRKKSEITVYNNGKGIPIVIHKEHKIYVPEMIFGQLLTGANFNDDEKKVVGGRNGYGAKLANIYSTRFVIECVDSKHKKKFKMIWNNNMSNKTEPIITESDKEDYVQISFIPDLKRFGMKDIDDDTYNLFCKRVYDLAGILSEKVHIHLNDEPIKIKGFKQYVDLYLGKEKDETGEDKLTKIHHKSERWEVILAFSDNLFQQVSFVNSICTSKGGTHVNYVLDSIITKLLEEIKKKDKKLEIKPGLIKNHFWIFINCLIENPSFDSQTKENMTLKVSSFGSKCELPEKFFKSLMKTDIIEQIIFMAEQRENAKLKKTLKGAKKEKITGIGKLEDANNAGTKDSHNCVLILTEGDSAKALAMAGMEIVGRDNFGVFPLKGKLLNVRDASISTIMKNEEIKNLITILGLELGRIYEDFKSLRYGGILIMTDQDVDGSHIKGLIINFIANYWPSLLKMRGFLQEFITPLIKVTKGDNVFAFFTMGDYRRWAEIHSDGKTKIKYYKGLGTSTEKEAREYFSEFERHRLKFIYKDQIDNEKIDLLFNKKKADERKDWLRTYNEELAVDHNQPQVLYRDFIDKELIHFSVYDNMRSIPSLVDGLKPGQRKVLFACFKRNLTSEIKVAQLSGYVAEHSAYHHGEVSLQMTIVNLAQNYVGSNNINILEPIGQFGTRATGGKDAASARYIHTSLAKITRFIFVKQDDPVMTYLNDDGTFVEPKFYVPILPMVLVNGAEGIGTGWSTFIPCFDPRKIVRNILDKLEGKPFQRMHPYFKGFKGEIAQNGTNYIIKGIYNLNKEDETIEITELPIGKWTRAYKSTLEEMCEGDDPIIHDLREYHTTQFVHFQIQISDGKMKKYIESDDFVRKDFKLNSPISTGNYVLFDKDGKLKRYESECEILEEFYTIRYEYYQKRKDYMMSQLERDISILENKERFIVCVINEELLVRNIKKKDLCKQLEDKKFVKFKDMPQLRDFFTINKAELLAVKKEVPETPEDKVLEESDFNTNTQEENILKEYNYLTEMSIYSLTYEQVEKLKLQVRDKRCELIKLQDYTIREMWTDDLNAFLKKLDEVEEKEIKEREKEDEKLKKSGKSGKNKPKRIIRPPPRKRVSETSSKTDKGIKTGHSAKREGQTTKEVSTKEVSVHFEALSKQKPAENKFERMLDPPEISNSKPESLLEKVNRLRAEQIKSSNGSRPYQIQQLHPQPINNADSKSKRKFAILDDSDEDYI